MGAFYLGLILVPGFIITALQGK